MLTPLQRKKFSAPRDRYAIVASKYNARYVDAMLRAAQKCLRGAAVDKLKILRVPGAYEIPVVAARLAFSGSYDAIICLGVILRGQTTHAQLIGEAVTMGLMQIQTQTGVPIIHEVLLLENTEQAEARCLGSKHNRGAEAAQTALEMVKLLGNLQA